jgi:dipeptidyl aminopeptidase/acylaminoacyl peptidase
VKGVSIQDFMYYHYLSDIRVSPDAEHVAFTVRQADPAGNGYCSNIYLTRLYDGSTVRLTGSGKDQQPIWTEDGSSLLFISHRDGGQTTSPVYAISLHGGEAHLVATIPHERVESVALHDKDTLVYTARVPLTESGIEQSQEYEVLEEIPFWEDGKGFIGSKRRHLFRFNLKTGELERLVGGTMDVAAFDLHGDQIAFAGKEYTGKAPMKDELWLFDLASAARTCLSKGEYVFGYVGEPRFISKDALTILATDMEPYGYFQSLEVLAFDLRMGTMRNLTPGWDHRAANQRVLTDVRHGSCPICRADSGKLYLTVTEKDSAFLYRVDMEGHIEKVVDERGSVDGFDVRNGKIVYIGLGDDRLQELYCQEGKDRRPLTRLNASALRDRYISVPEHFTVSIEGDIGIDAWLMKPPDFDDLAHYPAILAVHGGPKAVYGAVFSHEMQLLAAHGYVVFYCNPRGSSGRGDAFAELRGQYGTVDYDDLMACVDHVVDSYPFVDPDRIGVMGGSYGGFMTNWIIGHTNRFRAACSQRSIANWISMFCVTDAGGFFTVDQTAGTPWDEDAGEKLWRQSPLRYANTATTPTLFLCCDEDYQCWMDEAIQMFTALCYHDVESRLVLFRGESHDLSRTGKPRHRIRRLSEILAWFDRHLKPQTPSLH